MSRKPRKKEAHAKSVEAASAAPAIPPWAYPAAVGATALVSSISGLQNAFVFDDITLIEQNARVHDLGQIGDIFSLPYWPPPFAPELYRPLASLLHLVLFVVGGGEPLIFRIVSYLLYVACAIGVFQLSRSILSPNAALFAGLLFAAHPLHVEAVALGVNQGELIVGLIAALCVARYIDRRRSGGLGTRGWALIACAYGVSLLVKENAFVLPALLLASEIMIRRESPIPWKTLAKGYVAFGFIAAAVIAIRLVILGDAAGAVPAEALKGLDLGERAITMLQVVPKWLRLLAWPAHLQMDYSPDEIVAHVTMGRMEWLGLGIVVAWLVACIALRRREPRIAFGLLWCAIALFPVSNVIVPTGIMLAERTLLLPSIGFVIVVATLAEHALDAPRPAWLRPAMEFVCAALVTVGAVRSFERHRVWKNSYRLWLATSVDAPRSKRVRQAHKEAVEDLTNGFLAAAARSPEPWRERYRLAMLLRTMKADSEAVVQFRESMRMRPNQSDVELQLALALLGTGEYAAARTVAAGSAVASPDSAGAFRRLVEVADSLTRLPSPPTRYEATASSMFAARR